MRTITLPGEIEQKCVALSRELSLPFCGIDFKRTPSGDYFCFEVNPSPAYSYYQEHTAQPIADAAGAVPVGCCVTAGGFYVIDDRDLDGR